MVDCNRLYNFLVNTFGLPASNSIITYLHILHLQMVNKEYHQLLLFVHNYGPLHSEGLIPHPKTFPNYTDWDITILLLNFRRLNENFTFVYGHRVFQRPGQFCLDNHIWQSSRWLLPSRY